MRLQTLLTFVLLTSLGLAQTTGRHFRRDPRTPSTPAAATTQAADASARTTTTVAPLQKLRSGRPWPRHHFSRLPETPATTTAGTAGQPVDASHRAMPSQRRGFWRPRR